MPLSIAESLALDDGEIRFLKPANARLIQEVSIKRNAGALVGGPIDVPLHQLHAVDGDLAFFCIRGQQYTFVLRPRSELRGADPLARLLWSCGLDPHDDSLRRSPWPRLGRVLGGVADGRDEVRRRLEKRQDDELLRLLREIEKEGIGRRTSVDWPAGWQYRMPLLDEPSVFALVGVDGGVRVALGVVDASGQPPRKLLVTDGGLVWFDQTDGHEPEALANVLRRASRGLVPAAHRQPWVRWMRAEHSARLAALAGEDWAVVWDAGSWTIGGSTVPNLVDALSQIRPPDDVETRAPERPVRHNYPRTSVAFQRALDAAVRGGLLSIHADGVYGFRVVYDSGRESGGASLLDVLLPG